MEQKKNSFKENTIVYLLQHKVYKHFSTLIYTHHNRRECVQNVCKNILTYTNTMRHEFTSGKKFVIIQLKVWKKNSMRCTLCIDIPGVREILSSTWMYVLVYARIFWEGMKEKYSIFHIHTFSRRIREKLHFAATRSSRPLDIKYTEEIFFFHKKSVKELPIQQQKSSFGKLNGGP